MGLPAHHGLIERIVLVMVSSTVMVRVPEHPPDTVFFHRHSCVGMGSSGYGGKVWLNSTTLCCCGLHNSPVSLCRQWIPRDCMLIGTAL